MISIHPASARDAELGEFGGDVLVPGSAEFEESRTAALLPGRPSCILRPRSAKDVARAIRFGARSGLEVAVRGGGHSFAGSSSTNGGVLIDLGHLCDVEVSDAAAGRVRVGGGARWGDVMEALRPWGLAISSGDTKSVGVGGLVLGGGIGWKVRSRGLALDALTAVELVTADGSLIRADAAHFPELFWAIRGGGGGLGVVTAFEFSAHRTTQLHFGRITIEAEDQGAVLRGWADVMRDAPVELTSVANIMGPSHASTGTVQIVVAFDGDDEAPANRAIDPVRRLGTVTGDDVTLMPYDRVLEAGGPAPAGIRFLTRSHFIERSEVAPALAIVGEAARRDGAPAISLRALGGAVARVPTNATAYAHRSAELLMSTIAAGPDAAMEAARPRVVDFWRDLAPHVSGAYANFLDSVGPEDIADIYPPDTRRRLAAVKRQADPGGLFSRRRP